ncbi:hypothetical protein U0070_000737 [Myodes glareolus]|uniref:Membrane protein FAM174B n=1 Tax=Myodes glareolus TaxID=447135 RepID=A0AAW0J6I3_MYOGA
MSALSPPPPLLSPLLLLLALLAAPAVLARTAESASASQPEAEHQLPPSLGNATRLGPGVTGGGGSNSSGDAVVTRISSLLRDLPTLKAAVIVACAFSALLIACLLLRVFSSFPHSTPSSHPLVPSFHLQKKGEKATPEEPGDTCYAPDLIIGFRRFGDPRQLR